MVQKIPPKRKYLYFRRLVLITVSTGLDCENLTFTHLSLDVRLMKHKTCQVLFNSKRNTTRTFNDAIIVLLVIRSINKSSCISSIRYRSFYAFKYYIIPCPTHFTEWARACTLNLCTCCKTLWMGDQHIARPLPSQDTTKCGQDSSM
jgi:hypothetical protein